MGSRCINLLGCPWSGSGGAQLLEKKPCMSGMHGTERWGSDFLLSLGGWGVGVSDFLLLLESREVAGSSDFLLPLRDVGGLLEGCSPGLTLDL